LEKLDQHELHSKFIESLGKNVLWHSGFKSKPIEIDLIPPMPPRIRLYIYNVTHPPGGRTLGEHKIQLIVPGQARGAYSSFDDSDGRIVILAGYQPEVDVFVLWDAGLYPVFSYSRNVQVRPETVYAAIAGKIGLQERFLRGQGKEIVITASPRQLGQALVRRIELTRERLVGR
jgi:hypothetical protein